MDFSQHPPVFQGSVLQYSITPLLNRANGRTGQRANGLTG